MTTLTICFDINHCYGYICEIGLYKKIMKKILLAFDGTHFSEGAFEFAKALSEKGRILLTGVFLPQVDYANLWSYSGGGMVGPLFIPLTEDVEAEEVKKNIDRFESACRKNDIEYRVHKDFDDFVMPGLKNETKFADLLIIGSETFYENLGKGEAFDCLKDALHEVECPVVVVPEKFELPKTNILAYDGTDSSIFAIKQFAYLFPQFATNRTLMVYAKEKGVDEIPDAEYMEELVARHFPDLTITRLYINPRKDFAGWLSEHESAILVAGSFGRSGVSVLFRESFVSQILKERRIPIFITHQKF